mmetsp:Transcript_21228/g.68723  ORF Transcript_21228/g.68723 Transcript_21228/m.68723 type:complete len:83 (+) Transcript_21228:593-841(+)
MRAAWHDVWNLIHDEGEELKIEGIWRDSEDQVYEGMALDIDALEIQENANLLGIATRESRMREPGIRATRCDALDGARAEKS